ncbi:DUF1120 domain-containing protein [Pseudomonas zeae]|uniref:DUF1120 domain-containing protein n=1 Tax=Pseudomonas zeae TaxID=2745510 RepID=UPI0039E18F99
MPPRCSKCTELKIKGTIKLGSCKPMFTAGEVIDYRQVLESQIGQAHNLPDKKVVLAIECSTPIKVAASISTTNLLYFRQPLQSHKLYPR